MLEDAYQQAAEDGYVECGECGHQIEKHDQTGCTLDGCSCRDQWSKKAIRETRRAYGLPGTYRPLA